MSSFFGLCTLHSHNFSSMRGSRKRGLFSNSGTPGNWTTEAHRVDGLGPGWASSKSDFLMSDLLQNCSKAVLMGVEAPKAGSTDSLGGRKKVTECEPGNECPRPFLRYRTA
jgi:hypothetical protein